MAQSPAGAIRGRGAQKSNDYTEGKKKIKIKPEINVVLQPSYDGGEKKVDSRNSAVV